MIKLSFLFEDSGSCKQVFKGNDNKYYCRIEKNFYTCYPSNGYYEASEPVEKDNFIIEGIGGEYSSIDDFCKAITKELKGKLKTYEDMKEYLLKEWNREGYKENWIWNTSRRSEEILERYNYLGMELRLVKTESIHNISKKKVIEYAIYSPKLICQYIVGYEF